MKVNKCIPDKNILIKIGNLKKFEYTFQAKSIVRMSVKIFFQVSKGEKGIQADGGDNAQAELWTNMTSQKILLTWWWLKQDGIKEEEVDRNQPLVQIMKSLVGSATRPGVYPPAKTEFMENF